jgi:hypothetical protein
VVALGTEIESVVAQLVSLAQSGSGPALITESRFPELRSRQREILCGLRRRNLAFVLSLDDGGALFLTLCGGGFRVPDVPSRCNLFRGRLH